MLAPKRVKFRKRFKGRTNGMATRGNTVAFGHYGLMSLEPGWVSNRQIEAAALHLTRERNARGLDLDRDGDARQYRRVRPLRADVARARLGFQPADRGRRASSHA